MLPVLTVKQQAATYTNGLYVFSAKCSGKVLSDASDSKGLRQRVPGQGGGEDFDTVLRYHNSIKEKIAEEMDST
ncbi:hypothetical protein MRX96_009192 [Rhipicephalus microplus]